MNKQPVFLSTIGNLAATLATPVGEIRKALDRLGIKPMLVINGVEHFDEKNLVRRGKSCPTSPSIRRAKR